MEILSPGHRSQEVGPQQEEHGLKASALGKERGVYNPLLDLPWLLTWMGGLRSLEHGDSRK